MKRDKISNKKVQEIEFLILEAFDNFCKAHNLSYSLAYGTLLGAIRHQGFIPWDDDVDVIMARPDFEKLLELLKNKSLSSEFSYGFFDDPYYIYPYLKIFYKKSVVVEHKLETKFTHTPIWIDVFPIDGIPKNKIKAKLYFSLSILIRNLLYTAIVKPTELSGFKKMFTIIAKPFTKLIGPQRFAKLLDSLGKNTDFESSEKIGNLVWAEGSFEAMERDLILPQTKLNFENKTFPAPLNYHEHLKTLYGDYMKLPPIEEQKSHLSEEIYLLEN